MNTDLLNQMIDELEANLTRTPDFEKLAKRLGMNEFIMQRVFSVVTGMSMKEYLRRRRLSAAYADLKNSGLKVIEIALKYGWSSPTAFARSFKREFGCSPTSCRQNSAKSFKLFPALHFSASNRQNGLVEYRIETLKGFTLHGAAVSAPTHKKLSVAINDLYDTLRADGRYKDFDHYGRYAVSTEGSGEKHYLVGCPKRLSHAASSFRVTAGPYAVFEVGNKSQRKITDIIKFAEDSYEKSTGQTIANLPFIEKYSKNNCWIYVPLK